jgi:hypothetical protein
MTAEDFVKFYITAGFFNGIWLARWAYKIKNSLELREWPKGISNLQWLVSSLLFWPIVLPYGIATLRTFTRSRGREGADLSAPRRTTLRDD